MDGGAKGAYLSHPKALAWLSPHSPRRHPGDPISAWACLVSAPLDTGGLRLLIPRKLVPQNRSLSRTLPSPPLPGCAWGTLFLVGPRPPCLASRLANLPRPAASPALGRSWSLKIALEETPVWASL